MAQEENEANAGTDSATSASSATPKWDSFDGEMYPFLSLNEEKKRAGFRVQFLTNKPRKETVNKFNEQETDFWFDVIYEDRICTWTFSQKSLIMELQKHKPLDAAHIECVNVREAGAGAKILRILECSIELIPE